MLEKWQVEMLEALPGWQEFVAEQQREWWWLAINGPSCAASAISSSDLPKVSPIPQEILGFSTREEQLRMQQFLLAADDKKILRWHKEVLQKQIERGEVKYHRWFNPEPPTRGQTLWVFKSDSTEVAND